MGWQVVRTASGEYHQFWIHSCKVCGIAIDKPCANTTEAYLSGPHDCVCIRCANSDHPSLKSPMGFEPNTLMGLMNTTHGRKRR